MQFPGIRDKAQGGILAAVNWLSPFACRIIFSCPLFVPPGLCHCHVKFFQFLLHSMTVPLDPQRLQSAPGILFPCCLSVAGGCALGLWAALRGNPKHLLIPDSKGFTALLPPSGSLCEDHEDKLLLSRCHRNIVSPPRLCRSLCSVFLKCLLLS